MKNSRDRAVDIAYDLFGGACGDDGKAIVSKSGFVSLVSDAGSVGADLRKFVSVIEKHIEADRAMMQKAHAPS